jgi:hypothetical protein
MAETKTRASSSSGAKAKSKRAKPRKTSTSKAKTSKATSKNRQRKGASTNGGGQLDSARKAVESTAKQAGKAGRNVGRVAQKAKTPLLAGGAAVAGAAGGMALGARQGRKSKALRRPKVKIRSKDLAKAARNVGQFGMEVGEVATELRRNREQANGSKRRSPVEVVLEGLTHRGNGS